MKGEIVSFREFTAGMISSVNDAMMPPNALRLALNCVTDEAYGNLYGNIVSRPGYTQKGNVTEESPIKGFGRWEDPSTNVSYLVRAITHASDNKVHMEYLSSDDEWIEIGDLTPATFNSDGQYRFTAFLGLLWVVNGVDPVHVWDGDPTHNWNSTNINTSNAPMGYLIENFQDRLCIVNESTIYPSSLPIIPNVIGDPYTIEWSPEEDAIPINPDDNDHITAVANSGGVLAIWKRKNMYTWNGDATQSDKLINAGTFSQECVQVVDSVAYFFGVMNGELGFYAFRGGIPENMSRTIKKEVLAIPEDNYSNVRSIAEGDAVIWYVGEVEIDGREYQHAAFRLCTSKGTWAIFDLNDDMTASIIHFDGKKDRQYFGTSEGKVMEWGAGLNDNGSPIEVIARLRRDDMGVRRVEKRLYGIDVSCEASSEMSMQYRENRNAIWEDAGHLATPDMQYDNLDIHCKELEIQFHGMLSSSKFELFGIDIINWEIDPPTP